MIHNQAKTAYYTAYPIDILLEIRIADLNLACIAPPLELFLYLSGFLIRKPRRQRFIFVDIRLTKDNGSGS